MALSAIGADPDRRRDRARRGSRDSFPNRHDLIRDGLAGAPSAVYPRTGRQRADSGVRATDSAGARGDAGLDLAEPQLSAERRRQPGVRVADHPPLYLGHTKPVVCPAGLGLRVAGSGAKHPRSARTDHRRAGLGVDRAWRPEAYAPAADQTRRTADCGAVVDQHPLQLCGKPDHAIRRSYALDPGAADQDDPACADDLCGCGRLERGWDQPLGAGDLLWGRRRRHRLRPAKNRRQFHQRHHSFGRQVCETRRSRHHRRQLRAHQRDEDALHFSGGRRRP